jgi:hypothetical protein
MRVASTIVLGCVSCLILGCQRGKEQAVVIKPSTAPMSATSVPGDPFGSASPAYKRLVEVTDAALATRCCGALEEFAPWLEEQTVAVERSLALLKAIRVGPLDVYAVANGRIALVYDHIAVVLTEASQVAEKQGLDADWKGQEGLLWAQSNAFWARCTRGCATAGTHLDAWDLRCQAGLANSQAKLGP